MYNKRLWDEKTQAIGMKQPELVHRLKDWMVTETPAMR